MKKPGDTALAARLRAHLEGEVLFDPVSRGLYSTDASIYQIEPVGVVVPRRAADVAAALDIAAEAGVAVLPRGAGTSQCGQTVGEALVLDFSRHLTGIPEFDPDRRTVTVEPGVVLDDLNRFLRPHGLFFPVDVSTASRATIGGMTGNNSCGARSIRYGNMVHNVRAIDGLLADGTPVRFADVPADLEHAALAPRYRDIVTRLRGLAARESEDLARRFPKLLRRVGGYNIDTLSPGGHNMARLLVGSEGTLSVFTRIALDLQPIPAHRVLGVCGFPTLWRAMDATRLIVDLGPSAVELVDRTMIELAREIPLYRGTVERFVRGDPEAVLLVEFAGEDRDEQRACLDRLAELMADLGLPGAVVDASAPGFQAEVWEVRKAGLNIMMSMKGDGKPISFIEDCAVALEDLADYTARLTEVFARHGTTGTWYAHASVGCLHVRPVLDMKHPDGARKMRAIAEEAFALVREYKGSHSGEHGDGIVRSEFHEAMFGSRITRAFAEVKAAFDPSGRLNPGKIVDPPRMDDRELFRYRPGYTPARLETALDWSAWHGLAGAVEMCNNNGACRKSTGGVMCPSFRATGDERHLTRGRANAFRLALTGQLGPDALASDELGEVFDLCLGCKGCRRECPTGVDMARMKIEVLHQRHRRRPVPRRDRLIAHLPRLAPRLGALGPLANLRDRVPGLDRLSELCLGLDARRPLPRWRRDPFRGPAEAAAAPRPGGEVVLLADTFNTWFEPENPRAAVRLLEAAGFRVHLPVPADGGHPLCCGRTFLAAGLVDEARREMHRTVTALLPYLERDLPVLGLEPACLLTYRDELGALLPGADAERLAGAAVLLEEFLAREAGAGRLCLPLAPARGRRALIHGHCHQKSFSTMGAMTEALALVPGLAAEVVASGCCGMAGAFGYEARHYDVSMRIGELDLLPAVRAAPPDTLLVANGTSCRHQIRDGAGREAVHLARVLADALPGA